MRLWSSAALGLTEILTSADSARDTLTSTLDGARRHGFRPLQAHVMRLLGSSHATNGSLEEAEPWFRRAIRLAEELGTAPEAVLAQRELSALRSRNDRPDPARLTETWRSVS
jgi:hypothetical protein